MINSFVHSSRAAMLFAVLTVISGCGKPALDLSALEPQAADFDCENTQLLDVAQNPGQRGPWAVGAKTVQLGKLTTEIWYPAAPGSAHSEEKLAYDMRQFLPSRDAALIPDSAGFIQLCDCYGELPLDAEQGPYPLVILIHGTAGFRTASLPIVTHWASRGFVVLSVDNPGIQLKDLKANYLSALFANQEQNTVDVIAALQSLPPQLQFLEGRIDVSRVGIAGHSAGGSAASKLSDVPGVRTIIPMAAGGTSPGEYLQSSLIFGSELDGVVPYQRQQQGFSDSPSLKRFVGIANTGHLVYTELCTLGAEVGGVIPLVESLGVQVDDLFKRLGTDACGPEFLPSEEGWQLVNYASTAAFEELLQCSDSALAAFNDIEQRFPQLINFQQAL